MPRGCCALAPVHAPQRDTGHVVVTIHQARHADNQVGLKSPPYESFFSTAHNCCTLANARCMLLTIICCCTHAMADNPRGRFKATRLRGHAVQISTNAARSRGTSASTMHGAHQYYVVRNNCCFLTLSAVTRPAAAAAGGRGGRKRTRDRRRHPRRCARRVPHGLFHCSVAT